MRQTTIIDRKDFVIVSYGNGFAYDFQNKKTNESVFFQGDDALQFSNELDANHSLASLWSDYSDLARPGDDPKDDDLDPAADRGDWRFHMDHDQ